MKGLNMKRSELVVPVYPCLMLLSVLFSCASRDSHRLDAVRTYADNVLEQGIDRWSGKNTPLLADGIDVNTNEPLKYVYNGEIGVRGEGGPAKDWIIHNLASQQNLFRTLVGLTNLTGEEKYRHAAESAIRYHFDSLRDKSGLLRWGGHQLIDLRTLEPIGHSWRTNVNVHELKNVFPYYELMWDVDKQATIDFIDAFWNAHVKDWSRLEFNRHGNYGMPMGKLWQSEFKNPEPFFESGVLTFVNAGSDLIYSAAKLNLLSGEKEPLEWSVRLADQYVKARHPKTGLGAVQFTKPIRRVQPPEGPLTGLLTFTTYGDRAENQFGKDFPDVAREGWELFGGRIYTTPALMQLEIAGQLGEQGKSFLKWTVDGLKAYAKFGYSPADNHFRPMWADGTDLTGYKFPRTGYYGKEGRTLEPVKADEQFLFTYARAYRLSKDKEIWDVVRSMMKGLQLGDPGALSGESPDLNMKTDNSNPNTIFALLELSRARNDRSFLHLAEVVGDNILERSFHKGFFLADKDETMAKFDAIEPLALLSLEATLLGKPELVATYSGGRNGLTLKTE